MIVRYNGKRMFRCWQDGNEWIGVEPEYSNDRKGVIEKTIFKAKSKDELVDKIEAVCKYDEKVANGMNKMEAVNEALFG